MRYRVCTGCYLYIPVTDMNQPFIHNPDICIVIADDSKMNVLLTGMIISRILPSSYIQEAATIGDLLVFLHRRKVSVIFLNPGIPGYEPVMFAAQMKEQGMEHIPVVGLSTRADGLNGPDLPAGMAAMLSQPVEEAAMGDILRKVLPGAVPAQLLPRFDEASVYHHVGTDKHILVDIWRIVDSELHKDLVLLSAQQDTHTPELEDLRRLGHKLYGGARTVGLLRLAALARQLEMQEHMADALAGIPGIKEEIQAVFPLIQEQLNKLI